MSLTDATLTAALVGSARYFLASQLAVLRSCPDVISRLLKTGSSLLLAAKVLVISRLLHTKLFQLPNAAPYLDSLRNRIGSLRRRVLSKIDRRFKSRELPREILVEVMCAFSLATSSSPKDVLRHYHHIRLEAISENVEEGTDENDKILLALRLYVQTLRDTQAVIPGQLANALEKLKSVSLFKSPEVQSLTELNLDVHDRWIAEDIKTFTPYIRHDDLSKVEAERALKQWAKQAFSSFLKGLRYKIQRVRDPGNLMQLRQGILELWLSNHQHSLGIDTAKTLDGLRDVFNAQMTQIVQSRAAALDRVGSVVKDSLQKWRPGISDAIPSLWEPSMTSMEMAKGGRDFRERLKSRSVGRNVPLDSICQEYSIFLEHIKALEGVFKKLREARWADEIDDVDDDDDSLDDKQALLSEDDPRLLQEELNTALHQAFTDLQVVLDNYSPTDNDQSRGQKSIFLLRVWRELRQHAPNSCQHPQLGSDSIPALHNIVADEVLRLPLKKCFKRIKKMSANSELQTRSLWEGDPELPVLPSAWTYRFLLDLLSSMTQWGSDSWSPNAVDALKREVLSGITQMIDGHRDATDEQVNGHVNGDAASYEEQQEDHSEHHIESNDENESTQPEADGSNELSKKHVNGVLPNGNHKSKVEKEWKDAKIQRLFDVSYLVSAAAVKDMNGDGNDLQWLQESLVREIAMEPKAVQRVKKDAGEYWKRTSLLFALLA